MNSIFNKKENSLRRRRKRRKGHVKKHEASNCGTKEPKRPSETHIEWQPQGKVRPSTLIIFTICFFHTIILFVYCYFLSGYCSK